MPQERNAAAILIDMERRCRFTEYLRLFGESNVRKISDTVWLQTFCNAIFRSGEADLYKVDGPLSMTRLMPLVTNDAFANR